MNRSYQLTAIIAVLLINCASSAQSPLVPPVYANPYTQQRGYPVPFYGQPQYAQPNPYSYGQAPQYQPQSAPVVAKAKTPFREYSGYLGLSIDIVPAAVRAQMPTGITQGILVKEFAADSPAINSDLKPYDVIYAYGNTNINHPSQFIKLIRNDEPGKIVTLKIVHKGQKKDIEVTLGSQKTPNPKEFNGLAIKQIGKNKYNALIRFVGANGNKQMRSYKGTREEIFEQAINAQDLPKAERQQLLFATRPRGGSSNSGFGSFFPFGGKNESGKDWMNPSRYFKW